MDGFLDYVPLSWHRVPEITRDERGRLACTGRITDRWRGHPVGWTDHDPDGLVWVLDGYDGPGTDETGDDR